MAKLFSKLIVGRALFLVAALSAAPSLAWAGVTFTEPTSSDQPTVIRLVVTPAAEAVPAFKQRLMTREIDLVPGNAAPYYYRAFIELNRAMPIVRKHFNEDEELKKWYSTLDDEATPIYQLPLERVHRADAMALAGLIEDQLTLVAKTDNCDWELNVANLQGPRAISFSLEEFQQSRDLSRMLSMRTRLAIAEKRYEDAIGAMRINYRLSRDVATVPFIVCGLIGIAEAKITNGTMTELIAAPNSPNLYWALSELPQPMIDLRRADRFEVEIGERMFPFIHHTETTDRSPDEWNRQFKKTVQDLADVDSRHNRGLNSLDSDLSAVGMALLGYSHAKQQLIAQGMDRQQVEAMSVGQVIAIYSERNYQHFADGFQTIYYVPYWESDQQYRRIDEQLEAARPFGGGANRELLPIASTLLPALQAAHSAQFRLDREFAMLRVIEALRMYAADHAGGLPAKLDEIKQVPVPRNPATGKPFVYHLDGNVAVIELPLSDRIPGINQRCEITIATNEK
jgi:hypothetical protein